MSGARPVVTCEICERSLLAGEHPLRFSPDGREWVSVCPLCKEQALQRGWFREGGPSLPVSVEDDRPRGILGGLFRRRAVPPGMVAEPILRRLSEPEQQIVAAVEIFNASTFRRTVEGLTRSLGWPRVSLLPLSGVNTDVVLTICWDISWYQYRIALDPDQPGHAVRLAERGYEPDDLDEAYRTWNAHLSEDGLVVPDISPV